MSASHPTDVHRSLAEFRPRGGRTGPHADGWGVAFYEGRNARVFKEARAASESSFLSFVDEQLHKSRIVIGHIRKANPSQFKPSAANTHPFERELGGRSWTFAHNGKLAGIHDDPRFPASVARPIGETDSEHAFCFLLTRIAEAGGREPLGPDALLAALREPVGALGELGEFNFLMSDGVHLLAYTNTRLQHVQRVCIEAGCHQTVMVLATAPLSDERWEPLTAGRLHCFVDGQEVGPRSPPARAIETRKETR